MPVAAWDVFWVRNCRHTTPVPKDKYIIIITANPQILGFMISSNPPQQGFFIQLSGLAELSPSWRRAVRQQGRAGAALRGG